MSNNYSQPNQNQGNKQNRPDPQRNPQQDPRKSGDKSGRNDEQRRNSGNYNNAK